MQSSDSFFVVLATRFRGGSMVIMADINFFSMNLRVYYVISKHIGLIDVQGACENETPLLCPCFHRPSESIAIIFFQSSSVTGTRHVWNTSIYKPQKLTWEPEGWSFQFHCDFQQESPFQRGPCFNWLEVKQVASYSSSSSSSVRQDGGLTGWLDCLHK